MIPLTLPVPINGVDCTPQVIQMDARDSRESHTNGIGMALDVKTTIVCAPSVRGGINRSLDLLAFAEEVASRLPEKPDFSEDWLTHLVDNLAQFTD